MVQKEESEILQSRAASSVTDFVEYCNSPLFASKVNPCDKVIKNLFTFLCQDVAVTPVFSTATEGIMTLREERPAPVRKGSLKDAPEETEEQIAARITRRGAQETFRTMARRFGASLFEVVPKYWEGISTGLLAAFAEGVSLPSSNRLIT